MERGELDVAGVRRTSWWTRWPLAHKVAAVVYQVAWRGSLS